MHKSRSDNAPLLLKQYNLISWSRHDFGHACSAFSGSPANSSFRSVCFLIIGLSDAIFHDYVMYSLISTRMFFIPMTFFHLYIVYWDACVGER